MQSNAIRNTWSIKEIPFNRLLDITAEHFPRVALCENVLGKAFGAKTAVFLLRHFEYQFVHLLFSLSFVNRMGKKSDT